MTTYFWFAIYMLTTLNAIAYAAAKYGSLPSNKENLILYSVMLSIMTTGMLTLAYHAGIFYMITGEPGNAVAFLFYAAVYLLGAVVAVVRTRWNILTLGFGLVILYQMGSFGQFYAMIG